MNINEVVYVAIDKNGEIIENYESIVMDDSIRYVEKELDFLKKMIPEYEDENITIKKMKLVEVK